MSETNNASHDANLYDRFDLNVKRLAWTVFQLISLASTLYIAGNAVFQKLFR